MLPALVAIAASLASLPDGGTAQTASSHRYATALGAAIEEARRTPFHARADTDAILVLHLPRYLPAPPPQEIPETLAADSLPSFLAVFLPTLAATYLADFAAYWGLACSISGGGSRCIDNLAITSAVAVAAPLVVPGLVAGWASDGRFSKALLGSVLGSGVMVLGLATTDWYGPAVVFLPAIHTAVTAGFAMHR